MKARIQMAGQRFNRLLVLEEVPSSQGEAMWRCVCDCGNFTEAIGSSLRRGNTKSCGCLQRERASEAKRTHGQSKSLTHRIWCGIVTRCTNQNHHSYAKYGAVGIGLCERWRSYEHFLADMGECPPGRSIDRINNDKGYEPGNCRWATPREQTRNQTSNRLLTYKGETLCMVDWANRFNIKRETLARRIELGWSVEDCLTRPIRRR